MLSLEQIRIDGDTQARVQLDQGTVDEYADAYLSGAEFPPVTVFFDGAERWLADGFHRYFAAKKAGKKKILEHVIPGTKRDAILYSLTANATHGLKRTNADKRKAVEMLLTDEEWAQWSDRKIAEACAVSVSFVGALRRPEVKERQAANRAASAEKKLEKCSPTTPDESEEAPAKEQVKALKAPKVEAEDVHYVGPSQEEIDEAIDAAKADMSMLQKLIESDDVLADLAAANEQLRAELAVVKLSRDGYMNRSNELIERVKWLKKKLAKAEAANV